MADRRQWQRHELERAAQPVEQFIAVGRDGAAFAADLEARVIEPHLQRIAETDEGVAPETLAALHAFEQKARLERHELGKCRHRCVQIACNVECQLHNKKPIPECSGDGFWCDPNLWVVITACSNAQHPLLRSGATTSESGRRNWMR